MTRIDVNALLGGYPFRDVPHPEARALASVMAREKIDEAWVGHLPSAFDHDLAEGNAWLRAQCAVNRGFRFVPTLKAGGSGWEKELDLWKGSGAVAVRAYPPQWGLGPHDASMHALAIECGKRRLPLILTVRFEDLRQRSPKDTAGDLTAAAIRSIARAGKDARLIVCAAGKELIEEVHWALTPEEQKRLLWEISWIWGPPEDHLAKLIRTMGAARFTFGTHWPLRLAQNPIANLELLPPDVKRAKLGDPSRLFK